MSGASFKIEVDDAEARYLFAAIRARGRNPRPLLQEIGSVLEDSTRQRFRSETSPDGVKWAPISDEWREEKEERGFNTGILKMRGDLLNSVRSEVQGAEAVEIIASQPYAAIHQYGGTIRPRRGRALRVRGRPLGSVTMPARPYIGLSDDDRGEIVAAAQDFLDRASPR